MALWERLDGESVKAFNAFKTYLRLGNKRSLAKTAEALGHAALGTVTGWSSQFNWVDRVAAYDEADMEAVEGNRIKLMQSNQEQIVYDMLVDYNAVLDLWRESLARLNKRLENDPDVTIDARDIKDLVISRRSIDDIARRSVGLPNSFLGIKNEKPKELPEMITLNLPGAVNPVNAVDEDYEGDYDDTDDA